MGELLQHIKEKVKKRKNLYKLLTNVYATAYNLARYNHNIYIIILKIKNIANHNEKLKSYQFESVKSFCEINNLPLKVVEERQLREVFAPKYFGDTVEGKTYLIECPEIYIAEVFDIDIVGENSFLLKDDKCLYDMAKMENSDRYDLRFSSLKSISKNNEALILSSESNKVIKEGIFLVGFAAFNYYHLTFELLSKLKYIDSELKYVDIPILIDEIVFEVPQFKQLLLSMNKYNREIIYLKKGVKYKIEKLIYPSNNSWLPINVNKGIELENEDFRIAKPGMKYVRETIINSKNIAPRCEEDLKIFISRRSQYILRLINEEQIAEIFQQYGFKTIYPEEMTFDEQVDLFSKAKYVAGTTGAALTNILYCSKGAIFICIIPKEHKFNLYSTISKYLELEPIFLDAKTVKRGIKVSGDKFELNINYCQDFLQRLENQTKKRNIHQKY